MVITSATRNRVVLTGTWVRIPPSPPLSRFLEFPKTSIFCFGTFLGTHKLMASARVSKDEVFELASKYE